LIVIDTLTAPEIDPGEEILHVIGRVDRHTLATNLTEAKRCIGIVTHQRGHVERGRETGLTVIEQVVKPLVGLLSRAKAGELAHRPEAPTVHR
jgi:hypothetical protein